jgi:hypothetical protein
MQTPGLAARGLGKIQTIGSIDDAARGADQQTLALAIKPSADSAIQVSALVTDARYQYGQITHNSANLLQLVGVRRTHD